jgi:hypothetical protein
MATLHEYYSSDFKLLATGSEMTFTRADGQGGPLTVDAHTHCDTNSHVRFVSYFVSESEYSLERAVILIQNPQLVLEQADKSVAVTMSHPATYGSGIVMSELPFSGRIFLYIDRLLPDVDKEALLAVATQAGIYLQIRDRMHSDFLNLHEKPWAFISHDSRDKDELVRPLADKLRAMMCPVWYDEYSLKVGDSVRESIDRGLGDAPKCILVLSPNFLSNPGWTKGEFNAAMGKHFSAGGSVLLPIWHGVSKADVEAYSPMVADIQALKSDRAIDELARELFVAINPTT